MPKVKLTADDRRNELFNKQYRITKAILDKHDYEFAEDLGISRATISKKLQKPTDRLTLKEFLYLTVTWPDEKIIEFVRGK